MNAQGVMVMGMPVNRLAVPMLVLSFVLPLGEARPPSPAPHFELPNCSPPELPRAWQFSYRTALPPRAPTLVT